jgi:hypothetical protein
MSWPLPAPLVALTPESWRNLMPPCVVGHSLKIATTLSVAIGLGTLAVSAAAQTPPALDNKQVEISYVVPSSASNRQIYDQLRQRRVLEQLKQFLAPLRLPEGEKLTVKITDVDLCQGLPNAWFSSRDRTVSICYQYIDWYRRLAPRHPGPGELKTQDAIVGPFLEVLFHELGHAVFYFYKVPIFGREEDAADQIAAYLLTNFGKDVARRTLLGAAHFYDKSGSVPEQTLFADTHSTDWQRFYTNLCIAYGGHPETFQDLVDQGLLPQSRAKGCAREYKQIALAFRKHILPHVDPELLKQVQAIEWLKPDDGSCIVDPCPVAPGGPQPAKAN